MADVFRLEAYLHASELGSTSRLDITENGSAVVTLSLTTTAPAVAALAEWQSLANASGDLSGTYVFSYSDTTSRVTLARTDGGTFGFRWKGALNKLLGFTHTGSLSSLGTTHTGDLQPLAIVNPIGLTHDSPTAAVEVSKRFHRHGKAAIHAHYRAMIALCQCVMETTMADTVMGGPIFAQRVRMWQPDDVNPYSATNVDGYLDGYGHDVESIKKIGYKDNLTTVKWVISLSE